MIRECRHCGVKFNSKQVKTVQPENYTQALTQIVGHFLSKDVCDKKSCQDALQYECDEYDSWRKEEY